MAIYMKIDGITGSVTAKGYEGCIDVQSYQLLKQAGVSQQSGIDENRSLGPIAQGSLVLHKSLDASSIALLQHFYKRQSMPQVIFYHLTSGKPLQCYMQNTFSNVLICKVDESNDADWSSEEIGFHYTACEKRFTPHSATGSAQAPITTSFDSTSQKIGG